MSTVGITTIIAVTLWPISQPWPGIVSSDVTECKCDVYNKDELEVVGLMLNMKHKLPHTRSQRATNSSMQITRRFSLVSESLANAHCRGHWREMCQKA